MKHKTQDVSDKKIVQGILGGSEYSLRAFYQQYLAKLTNFVRQRIANENDVEEIVQDTLLATIEGFRDFRFQSTIYTFMCGIAKRKVVDYYRKRKLKRIVFSRIPSIESLLALFTTPEDRLDEKMLEQKIARTFQRLAPQHRMILRLKYVENYSVKNIARRMNMSFKSVESMLFRARKAFVRAYSDSKRSMSYVR